MSMTNKTWFRQGYQSPDTAWDGELEDSCVYHTLMNGGTISVVSRMTGFGWRDEETGYRSPCGKFWLASGHQDIRDVLDELASEDEMAQWVMDRANNCVAAPCHRGYPHRSLQTVCRMNGWDVSP